jgi:hypothetical protein
MSKHDHCPLDYTSAAETAVRLEAEYKAAGRALGALSGGGLMGMTPDSVRATPEWKAAKVARDAAFAALRAFNEVYTRRFKREIALARDARRGAGIAAAKAVSSKKPKETES